MSEKSVESSMIDRPENASCVLALSLGSKPTFMRRCLEVRGVEFPLRIQKFSVLIVICKSSMEIDNRSLKGGNNVRSFKVEDK